MLAYCRNPEFKKEEDMGMIPKEFFAVFEKIKQGYWTNGRILELLDLAAVDYRKKTLGSIVRNTHMNDLDPVDVQFIKNNEEIFQRAIEATLVDFINYVAATRLGGDHGLRTHHIQKNK